MSQNGRMSRNGSLVGPDAIEQPLGTSAALDVIFNTIDRRCLAGHYDWVDTLLASVPVAELSFSLLVGFLTITLQWKSELMEREDFLTAVRERAEREIPTRAEAVLSGL